MPLPCANVCRLDITTDEHRMATKNSCIVKCTNTLPSKLPTLLTKVEKSLDNEALGNNVLQAHFAALQEEWAKYAFFNNERYKMFHILNLYCILYFTVHFCSSIAKVIHAMRGRGHREHLSGLMLSLGAGPHDIKLLDAWSMGLPSNPA